MASVPELSDAANDMLAGILNQASNSPAGACCSTVPSGYWTDKTLVTAARDSTQHALKIMCDIDMAARDSHAEQRPSSGLCASIEIRGSGLLRLIVQADPSLVNLIAQTMLGCEACPGSDDANDLVAELANIIGGGLKDRLGCPGLQLGLPEYGEFESLTPSQCDALECKVNLCHASGRLQIHIWG